MIKEVNSAFAMRTFGEKLGRLLKGGEVLELVGDVGAGKTTLTKGIARGLDVNEDVQSPSFTISRVYDARGGLTLAHYDFYRLDDPGIMANELHESIYDKLTVTIIEWAKVVEGVLPTDRIRITISSPSATDRRLDITGPEELINKL
jgi:tRNA threonylcarbamoyladenosine biosynthesis protein TsaE